MTKIETCNLELLQKEINQIASTLIDFGFHRGELKYSVENSFASGPVEWLAEMWSKIKAGGRFLIAEMVESPNGDNYHYSGEKLFLEATLLNAQGRVPALLIELISIRLPEEDGSSFRTAQREIVEMVYHFQMLNK